MAHNLNLTSIIYLFALSAIAVASLSPERARQVEEINRAPGVLWQAGLVERFAREPPGASKRLCGVKPDAKAKHLDAIAAGRVHKSRVLSPFTLPESFDSATHWPQCAKVIEDIRDQSNCGCCWAFAAASAASDRLCIATSGGMVVPLSAQDVCFCASDDGCDGGDIDSPWEYIKGGECNPNGGAVSGGQYNGTGPFGKGMCSDFSLPHCHHHGPQGQDPYPAEGKAGCKEQRSAQCPKKCDSGSKAPHDNYKKDKYFFKGDVLTASGEEQIMQAIFTGGPVETAFHVYSDFENYASGIYHHVTGSEVGGHAVRIVGWGVEEGNKYWKIANSWNPFWGESGYFRIKRGSNESGVENFVTFSTPTVKWHHGAEELIAVV